MKRGRKVTDIQVTAFSGKSLLRMQIPGSASGIHNLKLGQPLDTCRRTSRGANRIGSRSQEWRWVGEGNVIRKAVIRHWPCFEALQAVNRCGRKVRGDEKVSGVWFEMGAGGGGWGWGGRRRWGGSRNEGDVKQAGLAGRPAGGLGRNSGGLLLLWLCKETLKLRKIRGRSRTRDERHPRGTNWRPRQAAFPSRQAHVLRVGGRSTSGPQGFSGVGPRSNRAPCPQSPRISPWSFKFRWRNLRFRLSIFLRRSFMGRCDMLSAKRLHCGATARLPGLTLLPPR